jgi:3-oxoacyl-[acyl-carrier protein] reductase
MFTSLKGRSVLVTGGSRGIGKGIARVFAQVEAKVAIVARHAEQVETAAREIGDNVLAIGGDVTSYAVLKPQFVQLPREMAAWMCFALTLASFRPLNSKN